MRNQGVKNAVLYAPRDGRLSLMIDFGKETMVPIRCRDYISIDSLLANLQAPVLQHSGRPAPFYSVPCLQATVTMSTSPTASTCDRRSLHSYVAAEDMLATLDFSGIECGIV